MNKFKPPNTKPIHIISSSKNANSIGLKLAADLSSGSFVFLTDEIKRPTQLNKVVSSTTSVEKGYVAGIVSGVEGPLSDVSVLNKTLNIGAATSNDGSFKINATPGDVLEFSYVGKKTVAVDVTEANTLQITLGDLQENLEEVVVTQKVENDDTVVTAFGEVNRDKVGYATQTIDDTDIPVTATDATNTIVGKFSGLDLNLNEDISKFKGRGSSLLLSEHGLIVIDGVQMERTTMSFGSGNTQGTPFHAITSHIDPQNIESITLLKGLAATNKYGTQGNNGVLVITTKLAAGAVATKKNDIPLGTTATYSGNAEQLQDLPDVAYINRLKNAVDVNEAFSIYLQERETHGDNASFYIDCHDYFKGWNNDLISSRVLSNVYEIGFDDAIALRALAYKQQEVGNYKGAVQTLKRVLKLAPKQAQSYKDLAQALHFANEPREALKIYNDIDKGLRVSNTNFTGIKKTLINDTKNLIFRHQSKVSTSSVNPLYLRNIKYKSRIIFEWNDLDAEFDLNIINPQKRFFTWSHTNVENRARISQEKMQGYGLEEFYLTSADVGEWTFNAKYYGKTSGKATPTFVKITIFKNFGQPNQSKEIKVIRLDKQDIEQTVAKVNVI